MKRLQEILAKALRSGIIEMNEAMLIAACVETTQALTNLEDEYRIFERKYGQITTRVLVNWQRD